MIELAKPTTFEMEPFCKFLSNLIHPPVTPRRAFTLTPSQFSELNNTESEIMSLALECLYKTQVQGGNLNMTETSTILRHMLNGVTRFIDESFNTI